MSKPLLIALVALLAMVPAAVHADVFDLRLNELQADNEGTLADDHDEYDDWFELVNTGTTTVSLDGLWITDDPDLVELYPLDASLTIPPGGYLVLWADGQPTQGPTHLSLRLSATGEFLAVVASGQVTAIDEVAFGRQFPDRVYQRFPDSAGGWTWGRDPSPGTVNTAPNLAGFIVLNELMPLNTETVADQAGDHDPWLELANPLPVPVSLDGVTLRNLNGGNHTFASQVLAGGDHALFWSDGEPGEGADHLPDLLTAAGGALVLAAPDGVDSDQVIYPVLAADVAFARVPDATGDWRDTDLATPGDANPASLEPLLVLNELLASNQTGITDETGAAEDWVELHNPGTAPVYLTGLSLTDDLADPDKFALPDVIIAPGGFLIVWCDNDPEDGPLHATFKLAAAGEEVALFNGDELLDHVVFGAQITDVSFGREVDAGLPWILFTEPTPGESNGTPIAVGDALPDLLRMPAPYPNPFNPRTTVAFTLARAERVEIAVFDARGRRVRRLLQANLPAGNHQRIWNGRDDRGRSLPSGVYGVRVTAGGEVRTRRVVLVQ